MDKLHKVVAVAALMLFGASGCADLDVTNPNEPDAQRALQTASDVESLVGGSFRSWYQGTHDYNGISMALGTASFQHSAFPANAGMVYYSQFPRPAAGNDPGHPYFRNLDFSWSLLYRGIASAAQGLEALENEELAGDLDEATLARVQAFGKFVLGISHGSVAMLFDKGFIIDETTDVTTQLEYATYNELLNAALDNLDAAIAIAEANEFTIPLAWATVSITSEELVRIAHSFKARYMAAVARTPEERDNVDWTAVLSEIDQGLSFDEDFELDYGYIFDTWTGWDQGMIYMTYPGWSQLSYFVLGMADQSGNYQLWLDQPIGERRPVINDQPILIVTPDTRFPQGDTPEEQFENPGTYWEVPATPQSQWAREARGTWRWSWYAPLYFFWDWYLETDETWPEIAGVQMRLLAAEAHYRTNNPGTAADLVNVTREAAGLNATDASGTNTSCVPKLPTEVCGDLFEMIKWEYRMEGWLQGLYGAPWYFHGRGWGDLYEGTPLQFPVSAGELQTRQEAFYTFGGVGGEWASDGSTYAWPGENE